MQGETLSSILCTCTIDKISNECDIENYKYRDSVKVPKLGFVDDLVDIQPCGDETKNMNDYTDLEVSKRKLQCGKDKCSRMHVGKQNTCEEIYIDSREIEKEKKIRQPILKMFTKEKFLSKLQKNDYIWET